jgi:hypothetical protein
MPYIIGVTKSVFMKVKRSDIGGAVIIDLDEKQLESPYDDG